MADRAPDIDARVRLEEPLDLRRTLRVALRYPTGIERPDGIWRATRTPFGPATVRAFEEAGGVRVQAWGPGASWAAEHAADLVGAGDDRAGFVPRHPLISDLDRVWPGVRIPRTRAVFEALVPAILEQKVQAVQARRAYRAIVSRYGEPAPGPAAAFGLRLAPAGAALARIPPWAFHSMNVERRRAMTLTMAARRCDWIDGCSDLPMAEAYERLMSLPGVGAWSAAEVAVVALGDPDAVSIGDFHLPHTVSHALAGDVRATDERMLSLLEPWRGHRARVVKLIELTGMRAPRFGPRLALQDIRGI